MQGSYSEMGVYQMLRDNKIPFDFVNFRDDLSVYILVILPDDITITPDMAEKLNRFVLNGGKIFASDKAGLADGKFVIDAIPADYIGESQYDTRYMRISDGVFTDIPHIDHVLYLKGQTVSAKPSANIMAKIVPPYFNRTYEHFCSHMQTPPMPDETDEPAIIQGKGAVYISHPLFADFATNGYKVYKDIFYECVKILLGKMLIETDLPVMSDVTLRANKNGIVVHTLTYAVTRKCNIDTIEDSLELVNKKYRIYTGFKPSSVSAVPDEKNVEFIYSDGFTEYTIDYQKGHGMVYISK